MGAEASIPLRPGDVVAGKYAVDRVLGVGGMGAVLAATDEGTGDRVAIKCLLPEHCAHEDVVARFHREARATFRLQNEHVARVFESGTLPSGVPYIVMEYLEGRDLRSLVKNQGPLPFKDAAGYLCQASVALAEAHALGIVHRDLKPANIFLTRRPNGAPMIKVLDFGIAKFLSPNIAGDHLEMTRTRAVLGSRAYMAPEQMLRPKEVDARADVWALGVILYFLVTGKNPFASDTTEGMIMRIIDKDPEPLSIHRPDAPEGFEAVILRCLSKARENRFANVTELARTLAPFARRSADRTTEEFPTSPGAAHDITVDGPLEDSIAHGGLLPPPPSGPLPPPPMPSSPTMRGFSVSSTSSSAELPVPSSESWAPTQFMQPRATRPSRIPMGAVVVGLAVCLAVPGALVLRQVPGFAPSAAAAPGSGSSMESAAPKQVAALESAPLPAAPPPGATTTAPSVVPVEATTARAVAPAPSASETARPVASVRPATPATTAPKPARPRPKAPADSPW